MNYIYCVDSAFPPGLIYREALAGKRYSELKSLAIEELGEPNLDINESMKDLYFIDNSDKLIPRLEKWSWLDFTYSDEFQK